MKISKARLTSLLLLLLLGIIPLLSFPPMQTFGEATTLSCGTFAVKLDAVPNTTGYLGFTWNNFVSNASTASPNCTQRVMQTVSVDKNKTVHADPGITTPLNKTYALDYDAYEVSAWNETGNLNWLTEFEFNATLKDHYILDESWIKDLNVTIYGNSTLQPDTTDTVEAYNFTSSSWLAIGHLNSTTRTSMTNSSFGTIADFIDQTNNNTFYLRILLNDTTDTDFTVHIDYVELKVTYELTVTLDNWGIAMAIDTDTVTRSESLTFNAPSDISGHNFTIYFNTPSQTLLTSKSVTVNGVQKSISAPFSFEITNLVSNTTLMVLTLPIIHIVEASGITLSNLKYQTAVLSFDAEATSNKTIKVYTTSTPFGVYVDNQKWVDISWSANILTINYDFGSTHRFDIYRYGPSPRRGVTTPTAPTTFVAPEVALPITQALIVIGVIGFVVLIYVKRKRK